MPIESSSRARVDNSNPMPIESSSLVQVDNSNDGVYTKTYNNPALKYG